MLRRRRRRSNLGDRLMRELDERGRTFALIYLAARLADNDVVTESDFIDALKAASQSAGHRE